MEALPTPNLHLQPKIRLTTTYDVCISNMVKLAGIVLDGSATLAAGGTGWYHNGARRGCATNGATLY